MNAYLLCPIEDSVNEEAILLTTVEARDEWEVMFSEKFLLPTCTIQVHHTVTNQVFFITTDMSYLEMFTLPCRIDTGVYHQLRRSYLKTKHKVKKPIKF